MADKTPEEIAAEAAAAAEAAKAPKAKTVQVRVLLDTEDHKCNDVVSLPADDVAAATAAGWADDHPSAVAYAKKLAKAAAIDAE